MRACMVVLGVVHFLGQVERRGFCGRYGSWISVHAQSISALVFVRAKIESTALRASNAVDVFVNPGTKIGDNVRVQSRNSAGINARVNGGTRRL